MKFRLLISLLVLTSATCCTSKPGSIPEGTWIYDLNINGVKAGKAVFSNTSSGNLYTSRNEMYLYMGTIENKSLQIITETKDFKPVKLEVYNTVTDRSNKSTEEINKTAEFKGNEVTFRDGNTESKFIISRPFVLDGYYFFNELLKKNFKEGTVVKAAIYEPSVELDAPILVIVEAKGTEEVQVGNRKMKLLHIKQRVEKLKSIDIYMNDKGIMEKAVIKMLNNIFELVRVG